MIFFLVNFIQKYYLVFKALHFIAAFAWMAGLFYLPRLFVYHVENYKAVDKIFQTMELRLYKYIINPAMISTITFGGLMLFTKDFSKFSYLYIKIICIFGLIVFQFMLKRWHKQLASGSCQKSSVFFRVINEIPTLFLILIVFMAIFKPF
jgi:protoporphyrinogen IX oxidase